MISGSFDLLKIIPTWIMFDYSKFSFIYDIYDMFEIYRVI